MTETIFSFLNSIGFTHPLHPAFTHIPMGMAMGAVVFRFASFLPGMRMLAKTGYHCVALALLGVPPTVVAGVLDWQHTFNGELEFLIVLKMVLAALFSGVLVYILIKDDPENPIFNRQTFIYLLLVLLAVGLGFSGGELQYG